ncbi:ATPase [Streptomyces sp. NPDC085596]|uniref:RapZ C-terminal domain-containing protein n=1 Tax=Streptomyces sp. NPDC085596 TaxID=3365731 RepID=UPI0037D83B5A
MNTPPDLSPLYPVNHTQVVITSFGYGHSPAPEADITLDTRRHLRNPHADPAMRDLTGLDSAVRQHVLTTPGARHLITNTAVMVQILLTDVADARQRLVTVATGCVGGRHRSVAIAEEITVSPRALGVGVEVEHRDIDKPVIQH